MNATPTDDQESTPAGAILVFRHTRPDDEAALALRLDLPVIDSIDDLGPDMLALTYRHDRLALCDRATLTSRTARGVAADFDTLDLRPGRAALTRRQPLARAIGREASTVVDATAGLGQDSVLLASLGWTITSVERSPIIAALLADGLDRLAATPHGGDIRARITLINADARTWLPDASSPPDVIYVDPMFPPRRKRSALTKQSVRTIRAVVGEDPDAEDLLQIARNRAMQRIVVKRPTDAGPLGSAPDFHLAGKLARYDVYRPNNA